ncbi:hypothetical protein BBD42_05240 [Paenibacillus sp. BIHB 4019]|uniref:DUF3885 domain-containing protein n=1 Tax=Paenibacillus sp. BIHB 4019 TaxID=1870819 RepID=A0A1B2DDZ2_9BACL|nr:DUF3885 domain-containing protein [Paenibacillus sp. BIHB 4019]ANY65934.1 hypothetical protein BBD42_05240 [Paenibacillus sp. BIHB 4019]
MAFDSHLDHLLLHYFKGLPLKSPIFYNAPVGIRFEMGGDICEAAARAEKVKSRALVLFNAINRYEDFIYFVLFMDSWDEHPVTLFEKDVYKTFNDYISGFPISEVSKQEQEYRYKGLNDAGDIVTVRYYARMKLQNLNVSPLLEAIANRSLGLEPIIDGDIYIINETNKTIFHLYDDRGLDIIAEKVEVLRGIYEQYNDWILDYDRKIVDELFTL